MGTKYNGPMPARLCYVADAFRYNGSASSRSSEFTQAGIELIGDGSCEADAEAIMVTISALLAAGLEEFQIDIGQVEFFKGLAEQVGLDAEDFERIRTHIDFKDSVSIAQVAKKYDADAEIIDILCRMPYLFGNAEVLEQAKSPKLNARSAAALENLEQVYRLLCACGLEKYVSIDLGMLQSLDYYTGVIFKGVTYDVGFSVCGGGRYDTLIGNFGKDTSAVGIAIGVNPCALGADAAEKNDYNAENGRADGDGGGLCGLVCAGAEAARRGLLCRKLLRRRTKRTCRGKSARDCGSDSPDGKWGGNHVCGRNSSAA